MIIGQSIFHYRILRKLGAGGMGEVYEAEDIDLNRKVALKILPEHLAAKPEILERFKREAHALAALDHPNIVAIYSVEQADSTHFISMELVEGRALTHLIPKDGFDLPTLFTLAVPLVDALAAAHARGIGHRDLSPSNIMINDQGCVKVIDFGLAKLFQPGPAVPGGEAPALHQTVEGQILGTPAYMSPEQIEGRKVDHRADIFSLGIVLCEMATAQRPFKGDTPVAVMSAILRDAPLSLRDLKPGLPNQLSRLIRCCLQKEPAQRFQSALEIRDQLRTLEEKSRTPAGAAQLEEEPSDEEQVPNNLPAQLTSFIGRERETFEISRLLTGDPNGELAGIRLLTLIGPGGTGKTRLALQVAARVFGHFRDGVWTVELAALSDPSRLPETVLIGLGLLNPSARPPLEILTRFLAPKRTLLLLDNCEHLVASCAGLAEALLKACPRLQILTTSREGLRLAGETTWLVPSLSVPNLADGKVPRGLAELGEYESIKLFVTRAQAVTPIFELNGQNAMAVAQLCGRLDGIPLAIELAAGRTRLLPVEQLLSRVQDRFRLLTGGSRTASPRQQTLRALVDWSYDLFSEKERLLFDRLSVFAGGWTLEAAEATCADADGGATTIDQLSAESLHSADILELLGHLVEKSMVVAERSADGTARYRLLETLRHYAQERLAARDGLAAEALCSLHLRYFATFADRVAEGTRGPDQVEWWDRFETELNNIRAALEWGKAAEAPAERTDLALHLAGALYYAWFRRGYGREGRNHLEALLSHPGSQRPTRARAQAFFASGSLALWQHNDDATALAMLNHSLALAEELGDTRVMANARHNLGLTLHNRGDNASALQHHEEALRLSRADSDLYGIRWALDDLAELAAEKGDSEHASTLYEEALSLARQTGDHHSIGSALQSLGSLARALGKNERAAELIAEGLIIMQRIRCMHCSAWFLLDLAFVARASGEPERAVRLLGAADALRERTGSVPPMASVGTIEQTLTESRSHLGEAAYANAWKEGRAMPLPQAASYALERSGSLLSS